MILFSHSGVSRNPDCHWWSRSWLSPGRRLFFLSLALLAVACAAPKPKSAPPKPQPIVAPPKPMPDNLEIVDYEVVDGPDQDWPARTRVFIDRNFAGQTDEASRSREKHWSGRVAVGNRLVRLERWTFPRVWDWVRSPDDNQPPERFVRVHPGKKTIVRLRLSDQGREHTLQISEQPLPAD